MEIDSTDKDHINNKSESSDSMEKDTETELIEKEQNGSFEVPGLQHNDND
jgi:hypothetical protein